MDTGKDRDTMRIQSQVLQGFDGACVWATGGGYDDASHGVSRHFQQVIRIASPYLAQPCHDAVKESHILTVGFIYASL